MRKPPFPNPGTERLALPEGARLPSRLGAGGNGNCPARGRKCDPPVGSGYRRGLPFRGRVWRKEEAARAGAVVSRELPACLPEVSLTFSVVSLPDRGRWVLLGASRPTEHPLPTPAGNPAGSRPTRTSLWPGQFLGKTDACHKPLGKRHPAFVLRESPALRGGLQSALFPGEALRANGAPGRAKAVKGRAVSRKAACLESGRIGP